MKLSCERSSSISSFVNPFNEPEGTGEGTVYLISDLGDDRCSMTETNPQVVLSSTKSPTLDLKDLFTWLEAIKLEQYYELLVDAGYDNSIAMMQQMRGPMPITESDLSMIGIHKPGHRKRILWKLEDSLPEKHNRKKSFGVFKCCGQIRDGTGALTNVPDLSQVLRDLNLSHLLSNFQNSGHDNYEILISQFPSSYGLSKSLLESDLGISDSKSVRRLLTRLSNDVITFKPPELVYEEGRISACELCVIL